MLPTRSVNPVARNNYGHYRTASSIPLCGSPVRKTCPGLLSIPSRPHDGYNRPRSRAPSSRGALNAWHPNGPLST
ncbi:hypothetical protein Taro_045506 [Colocasia esculenta]|uniref:Uncharacterized protein n=1 Tax=Colocasia esculenta TaxID=4460 RepID=A0A843X0D6_COLES|nr:hypothetical protein [Colocasia esculenta]